MRRCETLATFRSKNFTCPFYRRDTEKAVYGEACNIHAPTAEAMDGFVRKYCASDAASWRSCPIARMLLEYYDRDG